MAFFTPASRSRRRVALSRSTQQSLKLDDEPHRCKGTSVFDFAKFDSPFQPQVLTRSQIDYTSKHLRHLLSAEDAERVETGYQPSANARLQLIHHFPGNLRFA